MMMYNKLILDYFFKPLHVGILDEAAAIKVQAKNMDLYIQIDASGKIVRACFKSNANPYKIAGLEWLCRELEGDMMVNHPRIDYQQIAKALDLPVLKYSEAIALEGMYKRLIVAANNRG